MKTVIYKNFSYIKSDFSADVNHKSDCRSASISYVLLNENLRDKHELVHCICSKSS